MKITPFLFLLLNVCSGDPIESFGGQRMGKRIDNSGFLNYSKCSGAQRDRVSLPVQIHLKNL